MKVLCPTCKEVFYTNPFRSRTQITCENCHTKLQQTKKTQQLYQSLWITSMIIQAIISGIVSQFTSKEVGSLVFFGMMMFVFIFEMIEKQLQAMHLLEYEPLPLNSKQTKQ